MLLIPFSGLSFEAFDALLEEVVSRDGTDYGDIELSLDVKKQLLKCNLEQGLAFLVFDPMSESCNIVDRHTAQEYGLLT